MQSMLSTALGVGAIVFGIPAVVAPGRFAKLFGIASADDPTVATAIRSVGIRDVMIGLGLVRSLQAGDARAINQWLLARAASDAGDTVAVGIAVAGGARNRRFLALGALAIAASGLGAALLRNGRAPTS
jgi:uncharacterized protein YjeT (DUF2065 family)